MFVLNFWYYTFIKKAGWGVSPGRSLGEGLARGVGDGLLLGN